MKKFIGVLVLIVLLAGSVCGVVYSSMYYLGGSASQAELNKEYNEGYDEGLKQGEEWRLLVKQYETTIAELTSEKEALTTSKIDLETQLAEKTSQLNTANTNISNLEVKNSENQTKITNLETQITDLETQVATLQASNEDKSTEIDQLNSQISTLQAEKSELEAENENNLKTISDYESQVATLNSEIADLNSQLETKNADIAEKESEITSLNNEVTRLTAELEAYKDMELTGVYNIEFLNGDTVVASTYVEEGDSLYSIPEIANTQDTWFYGWTTTEGSKEVFDFTNYIPTQDQTFYAVLGECVNFAILNVHNSNVTEKWIRVGADLTIGDVLTFMRGLDVTADENLIFKRMTGDGYETIDLNMKIVDLPYGKIANDGNGNCVKAHALTYMLRYQYSSDGTYTFPETGYPTIAVEDYLVDYTTISNYSANLSYVLNNETVETQSIDLDSDFVQSIEFESGAVVNFECRPYSSSFGALATATNLNGGELCLSDVSCQFSLSTEYVRVIESAVDIDLDLYWEAETTTTVKKVSDAEVVLEDEALQIYAHYITLSTSHLIESGYVQINGQQAELHDISVHESGYEEYVVTFSEGYTMTFIHVQEDGSEEHNYIVCISNVNGLQITDSAILNMDVVIVLG